VPEIGVLILGGGEATRLPGKLELAAGDLPMIARVLRNVSSGRETFISCKATFAPGLDDALAVPMVVDRWLRRGPLAGMMSTMARMRSPWIFAVAGDAPLLDSGFVEWLASRAEPGDEALVPVRDRDGQRQLEPLAALYDRLAFLREGLPVLRSGRGMLGLVVDRLRAHLVAVDELDAFANVNTPHDYEGLRARLEAGGRSTS